MIYLDPSTVEVIPVGSARCECGGRASWKLDAADGARKPYCGWCAMYGDSAWARENREELAYVGEHARTEAQARPGGRELVLDERHRLSPDDAERYMIGMVLTSRLFFGPRGQDERPR